MDARQARTWDTLTRSILELAGSYPLAEISVTDIARHAGISRPTFYAHADGPGDLLASALGMELERLRETFDAASSRQADAGEPAGSGHTVEDFQRALVTHVYNNAPIYRRNLRQRLPQQLRDGLIDHIEWGLLDHLVRHPHIAPLDGAFVGASVSAHGVSAGGATGSASSAATGAAGGSAGGVASVAQDEARYQEAALYAAIAASGTVAALETWLRGPDPLDQEWAVRAILRGIAEWWSRE
ncbi:MAG: hypothetical protein JWQ43_984 [Glaciihabitans sp.]|nr:hypothetical protein [Glaciihabitans sp.]